MHRTNSESGASTSGPAPKISRILRRFQSKNFKEDRSNPARSNTAVGNDPTFSESLALRSVESSSFHENPDSNSRQLQLLVQRMRSAPSSPSPSHVDTAYKEFSKCYERAASLCSAVLQDELRPYHRAISNTTETVNTNRDSSIESPRSPAALLDSRSSFSGRSLGEVMSNSGGARTVPYTADSWLGPIRDWKNCLESLTEAFKTSLVETYKSYEKDATPEMLESLFASKKFRREAVNRMRNASVTRVLSADPQFFPRYEIRFRNYERVKTELSNIRQILQRGESNIAPSRSIIEFPIVPRGDAVLEFANLHPDATGDEPVLRFRVSPHVLSETSPIFARMFSGRGYSLHVHDAEDIDLHLPAPPSRYYCADGSEAWLFRMPQLEVNDHKAMEIMMHAAHMHNNLVPRDVSFEQFVAIAECSLRYKTTSPLEVMVEHRWLPQWMHRGADDMPDGLLIISYAFGSRGLFTRMSKSAILNLLDEKDLNSKPWPRKIKDKIWAVRSAKAAQLYECCTLTLQDYLHPPNCEPVIETDPDAPPLGAWNGLNTTALPPKTAMPLVSTPRCPKGSHWCDAANLGWLMLVFNNMGITGPVLQSNTLSTQPVPPFRSRSLVQIVEMLRSIPSPVAPVHRGGVCDPIPSFKMAIADIYNTVTGLTLRDVSGKSHGWALSKNMTSEPQTDEATGLMRMAAFENNYSVATELPESVLLRILSEIQDVEDLHAAARVNRAFYETYQMYELPLIRNILRVGRVRSGSLNVGMPIPISSSNAEGKSLTSELSKLTERNPEETLDAQVSLSEDGDSDESSDDSDEADEASDDEMPVASAALSSDVQQPPEYQTADSSPVRNTPRRLHIGDSQASHSDSEESSTPPLSSRGRRRAESEEPMTEEEARRILWPDIYEQNTLTPNSPTTATTPSSQPIMKEKFRVGDPSFVEGLEDKTLLSMEGKQLKGEHESSVTVIAETSRTGA